jgi:hypothetical protein
VFFKQTVSCEPPLQCGDSVAKSIGSTTFTVIAGAADVSAPAAVRPRH